MEIRRIAGRSSSFDSARYGAYEGRLSGSLARKNYNIISRRAISDRGDATSCIALGGSSIIRSFLFFSRRRSFYPSRIAHARVQIRAPRPLLILAVHFPPASNRILGRPFPRRGVRFRVRHAIRVFLGGSPRWHFIRLSQHDFVVPSIRSLTTGSRCPPRANRLSSASRRRGK